MKKNINEISEKINKEVAEFYKVMIDKLQFEIDQIAQTKSVLMEKLKEQTIIRDRVTDKVIFAKWYNRWYWKLGHVIAHKRWKELAGSIYFYDDCIERYEGKIKEIKNRTSNND